MMKETRFKELLNAHLDGCLDPAGAAELHAELQANPDRRRELRAHQRIQAGCSVLFERAARQAPCAPRLTRALRQAEERMQHPRGEHRGWSSWVAVGGLAACVALVAMRISGPATVATVSPPLPADKAAGVAFSAAPSAAANAAATRLPEGLGFAALGLGTQTRAAGEDAASKWALSEAEIPPYALEEIAAMNRAVQLSRRGAVGGHAFGPAATGGFSQPGTPAWAGPQTFPVEAASYRFER